MNKKIVFVLVLLVLSIMSLWMVTNQTVVKANPKTIIVPNDYTTIQTAIGNATASDTVFVKSGTYYETLTIEKPLSLIGEDRDTTIIEAPVTIDHSNVTIAGFTIQHATQYISGVTSFAVDVYSTASYCSILGNRIRENDNGVRIISSPNNNIIGNIIESNPGVGIMLYGSSSQGSDYNNIQGNEISNGVEGIVLRLDCSNNNITKNYISKSSREGILLSWASNNAISENNITDSGCGIGDTGDGNTFFHNNFINNTQQVYTNWLNEPTGQVVISVGSWNENYWSDYNGTDNNRDGKGDTPYVINEKNQDNHPLMKPVSIAIPEFPSLIFVLPIIIAVSVGLLVYFKKRNWGRTFV